MKINSSQIQMESSRSYSKVSSTFRSARLSGSGNRSLRFGAGVSVSFSNQSLSFLQNEAKQRTTGQQTGSLSRSKSPGRKSIDVKDGNLETLKKILASLSQLRGGKEIIQLEQRSVDMSASMDMSFSLTSSSSPGIWKFGTQLSSFMEETENTTFSTTGIAKTADGREISFNIDLEMSRSFLEQTQIVTPGAMGQAMVDPLVINLGSDVASVSDQKFLFDIDGDGKQDSISQLNSSSGFLALDKNNDGKINDGNELFGAKSGDGFKDLAAYDKDKNGWIDESDEIFEKLKIWTKDEKGKDKLISLKEAGVGAIYLGNVSTDFNLNHASTNQTNAQIRKTGIFLKENGAAGTMQHVDFAI